MEFKPTLAQAVKLILLRRYDANVLIKSMTLDERESLFQVIQLVQQKLAKGDYPDRDFKSPADIANNAKRKSNNIAGGSTTGVASMPHQKEWGGSGADAAGREAAKAKALSAKNHVEYTHNHPETGESVTVKMSPRKLKNYQRRMAQIKLDMDNKKGVANG